MIIIKMMIIIIISRIRRAERSCFRCVDKKNNMKMRETGIIWHRKFIALRE